MNEQLLGCCQVGFQSMLQSPSARQRKEKAPQCGASDHACVAKEARDRGAFGALPFRAIIKRSRKSGEFMDHNARRRAVFAS
jgi:hypothetical protein